MNKPIGTEYQKNQTANKKQTIADNTWVRLDKYSWHAQSLLSTVVSFLQNLSLVSINYVIQ